MTTVLPIFDVLPPAVEFYTHYWGRLPFVVRGAVPAEAMSGLIVAEELAALACEDVVRSRLVHPPSGDSTWSCQFGPFNEDDFHDRKSDNWSLLVQNVEQFHPETATLLQHFNFSPRWLLDDIMVSYATPGGSVGPHMDSYHVFLVQGSGQRRWKIGHAPLTREQEIYIDDLDLKVLRDDFAGDEVTVSCGDVIYIPPRIAHQGITLENSLTYSVGFLGPKLSDLFMAYGQFLSELDALDQPYAATNLSTNDVGFALGSATLQHLQDAMVEGIHNEYFGLWISEFFAGSSAEGSHEFSGDMGERDVCLTSDELLAQLSDGGQLIKPSYSKLVIVQSTAGDFYVGFGGKTRCACKALASLIDCLCRELPFGIGEYSDNAGALELITTLYNDQALERF